MIIHLLAVLLVTIDVQLVTLPDVLGVLETELLQAKVVFVKQIEDTMIPVK